MQFLISGVTITFGVPDCTTATHELSISKMQERCRGWRQDPSDHRFVGKMRQENAGKTPCWVAQRKGGNASVRNFRWTNFWHGED
jgi:hypothetical protein